MIHLFNKELVTMRPLTKSRFKLALECPTKLYYANKSSYQDQSAADPFMDALAEGGFQVGELAKYYYTGGHSVTESGYEAPLKRTKELLLQENVIIFEAAIQYRNFFIRIDLLEKIGNTINLIEVKAKSFDSTEDNGFLNKKGHVSSGWNSYLQDVAFQKYVMQKAFPEWSVKSFLMMADKSKKASVTGLNQLFQIDNTNGRKSIKVKEGVTVNTLGDPILKAINVDSISNMIISDTAFKDTPDMLFEDKVNLWSEKYDADEKIISQVGIHCFGCEFNTSDPRKRSGFRECWSHFNNWTEQEYQKPKTTDIWNFRRKSKLFDEGILFIDELEKHHISDNITPKPNGALSAGERQWLQVEKVQNNDNTFYLDRDGMKDQMSTFKYPLHFIDFETSMVAIPFYKGQHPYEQIAFQFSHHIMRADGSVEHIGEFIETAKGIFPNFNFVRALKKELENDGGTIFKFAAHENTVLNQVCCQLYEVDTSEVADKDVLIEFIHSITHSDDEGRKGERDMVDMNTMVKDYFYDPLTGGSNSIKAVLPAVLERSKFIQDKYSKSIYGKTGEIKSLNFEDGWVWIQKDKNGRVINPYELLPSLFEGVSEEDKELFITHEHLADGGAALSAFGKMQFTDITKLEHSKIVAGLLKYCELDTLAMVMIYEFWLDEIGLL